MKWSRSGPPPSPKAPTAPIGRLTPRGEPPVVVLGLQYKSAVNGDEDEDHPDRPGWRPGDHRSDREAVHHVVQSHISKKPLPNGRGSDRSCYPPIRAVTVRERSFLQPFKTRGRTARAAPASHPGRWPHAAGSRDRGGIRAPAGPGRPDLGARFHPPGAV